MIRIKIKNVFCYVNKSFNGIPLPIQNKIVKEMSYYKILDKYNKVETYLFQKNPKYPTLLNPDHYYLFPTGLIFKFIKLLKENGISYNYVDLREKRPPQLPLNSYFERLQKVDPSLEDREYQRKTIEEALRIGRGIVSHSTSAGKSLVICGVVYCINVKTLVICIGIDHAMQISKDIQKYTGRKVTRIISGECDSTGNVVVTYAQSIDALKKRDPMKFKTIIESFKCVIMDEVHKASSVTNKQLFYHAINAIYRYGFSGTVYREDNSVMEIIGMIGPIFSKIGYTYLTENNYICQARFFFIDPMCDLIPEEEELWPQCLKPGIIENDKRNQLIKKICDLYTSKKKQVLVITPLRIKHGKELLKLIPDSVYIYGESEKFHRENTLKKFASKKFNVLISSTVFDQAINIPDVRCVILAGGGKAHNAVYQRIGRGIRKAPGKDFIDIIVLWDSHSRILLSHSKKIKKYISNVDVWKNQINHVGKYRAQYE